MKYIINPILTILSKIIFSIFYLLYLIIIILAIFLHFLYHLNYKETHSFYMNDFLYEHDSDFHGRKVFYFKSIFNIKNDIFSHDYWITNMKPYYYKNWFYFIINKKSQFQKIVFNDADNVLLCDTFIVPEIFDKLKTYYSWNDVELFVEDGIGTKK